MSEPRRSQAAPIVVTIVAAVVLAVANLAALLLATKGTIGAEALQTVAANHALVLATMLLGPLGLAALAWLLIGSVQPAASLPAAPPVPMAPPPPRTDPALRLLGLLQQEARLVDFICEDIAPYSDAQVGAAVRSIHAGCRTALDGRIALERIFSEDDGSTVVVDAGFDPAAIRLTGNVAGAPPFRGILQHAGWRVASVTLPETLGDTDPRIIAPAEVEIP